MVKIAWLLVVALLGLSTVSCVSKPVLSLHSAQIRSASMTGVGMTLVMRVRNDNSFDVQIRNVRANVVLADRYRLPTIYHNPQQWLPAGQTALVAVPIVIPWTLISPIAATTAGSPTVRYRVTGLADVTAVRMLGIESNDYELDEVGSVSRTDVLAAATRGVLAPAANPAPQYPAAGPYR